MLYTAFASVHLFLVYLSDKIFKRLTRNNEEPPIQNPTLNVTDEYFVTFQARLRSFEKCNYNLHQSVNSLCEAGFYYIGIMFLFLI